jgi:hypothetical protein
MKKYSVVREVYINDKSKFSKILSTHDSIESAYNEIVNEIERLKRSKYTIESFIRNLNRVSEAVLKYTRPYMMDYDIGIGVGNIMQTYENIKKDIDVYFDILVTEC